MTVEEYFKFHKNFVAEMTEITKKKNSDYCGTSNNPFSNFTTVETNGICTTEQGFLTRMSDKMSRITSFMQKGTLEVKDESVTDTLQDLANYAILMAAYIESKRGKGVSKELNNKIEPLATKEDRELFPSESGYGWRL